MEVAVTAVWKTSQDNETCFLHFARKLVEESKKEDGCIQYDLYKRTDALHTYVFVEIWKDEEALKQHTKRLHYITYVRVLELAATCHPIVLRKVE